MKTNFLFASIVTFLGISSLANTNTSSLDAQIECQVNEYSGKNKFEYTIKTTSVVLGKIGSFNKAKSDPSIYINAAVTFRDGEAHPLVRYAIGSDHNDAYVFGDMNESGSVFFKTGTGVSINLSGCNVTYELNR